MTIGRYLQGGRWQNGLAVGGRERDGPGGTLKSAEAELRVDRGKARVGEVAGTAQAQRGNVGWIEQRVVEEKEAFAVLVTIRFKKRILQPVRPRPGIRRVTQFP